MYISVASHRLKASMLFFILQFRHILSSNLKLLSREVVSKIRNMLHTLKTIFIICTLSSKMASDLIILYSLVSSSLLKVKKH